MKKEKHLLSIEQRDAFDGAVKALGVIGSFSSAAGGTYLGIDSIKGYASEKFIMMCNYIPALLIIPAFYFFVFISGSNVAIMPQFKWGMFIGWLLLVTMFAIRFLIFWKDQPIFSKNNDTAKRIGWIMLVFGFDLILIQQVVDATGFFLGK